MSDKVNNVFFFTPPPMQIYQVYSNITFNKVSRSFISFHFLLFFEYEYNVDASGDSLHIRELIWARSQKRKMSFREQMASLLR